MNHSKSKPNLFYPESSKNGIGVHSFWKKDDLSEVLKEIRVSSVWGVGGVRSTFSTC